MKLSLLIVNLLIASTVYSQTINWQPYGQPNHGASCFAWNSSKTKLYKGTYFGGVHMSLDSGLSWQSIYPGLIGGVYSVAVKNDTLFAEFSGCSLGGVRYTPNDGLNWTRIDNGVNMIPTTYEIAANSQSIFVAGYDNVCKTDNNGTSWQLLSTPHTSGGCYTVAVDGSVVAAAGWGKVYVSYDNGTTWVTHTISASLFSGGWGLYVEGNKIFVGTSQGLFKSTDFGFTWTNLGIVGENIMGIRFFGQYGFVSSANNPNMISNVYFSADGGDTWVLAKTGLPSNPEILDFAFIDNKVIAGGWGSGMWYTNLNVTGIEDNEFNEDDISIYPNPADDFITVYTSETTQSNKAEISIHDILGNNLMNAEMEIINQTVKLDVSQFESGVYLVTYKNKIGSETQKIVIY